MRLLAASALVLLVLAPAGKAQSLCEDIVPVESCPAIDPPLSRVDPIASYYSTSLDGTLTATGEIFRNRRFTAAHLTLPLGSWIEVRARATDRTVRLRFNDRGPYVKKFCLDLSQAAARARWAAMSRTIDTSIFASSRCRARNHCQI
ncbi:MAG TPA: septal ring lytic transglycosylase RlpA family protein [Thermoanaerobaculia bacterium]